MFLRSFRATRLPLQAWPQRSLFSTQQAASVPPSVADAVSSGSKKGNLNLHDALITVKKGNVKQSPLRMKFLVMLIRDLWVPDALAQLKFSPKHKAVDLANMVKRAIAMAKMSANTIPEELVVKEIFVTKGATQKKVRIMGRGRAGISRKRSTHVTISLDKVDFAARVADARGPNERRAWQTRWTLVNKLRGVSTPAEGAEIKE